MKTKQFEEKVKLITVLYISLFRGLNLTDPPPLHNGKGL